MLWIFWVHVALAETAAVGTAEPSPGENSAPNDEAGSRDARRPPTSERPPRLFGFAPSQQVYDVGGAAGALGGALAGWAMGDLVAAGDIAGLVLAAALPEGTGWDLEDWVIVDGSGAAGWMAGAATATLADDFLVSGGSRALYGAAELAGGTTVMAAAAIANQRVYLAVNPARSGIWTAQGAWVGFWVPHLWSQAPGARLAVSGLELGAALGWMTSLLTEAGPSDFTSLMAAGAWAATGTAVGVGVPMAALGDEGREAAVAAGLAAGVAGSGVGTRFSGAYDTSGGDTTLLLGGQAWGAWQAGGWAAQQSYLHPQDTRRIQGAALVGYGAGAAYGLATPLLLDLDAGEALIALSGGGWGSAIGWGSASPFDSRPPSTRPWLSGSATPHCWQARLRSRALGRQTWSMR